MRIWKVLALLAGMAGVVGFFTPLIEYRTSAGVLTGDASAFQIARGAEQAGNLRLPTEQLGISPADSQRLTDAFRNALAAYRGTVIAYFSPAALLALLAILALVRDRMGRLSGLVAILLGGACTAVFALFWQADQQTRDPNATLGLGLYLLLAAGLGGALAGLGALLIPDRGADHGDRH